MKMSSVLLTALAAMVGTSLSTGVRYLLEERRKKKEEEYEDDIFGFYPEDDEITVRLYGGPGDGEVVDFEFPPTLSKKKITFVGEWHDEPHTYSSIVENEQGEYITYDADGAVRMYYVYAGNILDEADDDYDEDEYCDDDDNPGF